MTGMAWGDDPPPIGELVAVLWEDAYGDDDGGWHPSDIGPGYPLARCVSVGRLLQFDRRAIAVAPHWTVEPEEVSGLEGGRIVIPTNTVLTMQVFEGAVSGLMAFQGMREGFEKGKTSTH